jgi:16S rRNA (uracil1498-N3)-methyltransferase
LCEASSALLFNGHGREVTALGAREVELRKLHEAATPPLRCRITLGQAIPKGKNMDLIVQKAVEIGTVEIVPIISDRTIVRLDADDAAQQQSKVAGPSPSKRRSNAARTACR